MSDDAAGTEGGDAGTGPAADTTAAAGTDKGVTESAARTDTDGGAPDAGEGGGGKIDNTMGEAFDRLAREAYERGREVLDPTTVIAGRDATVTVRTHLVMAGGPKPPPTPGRMRTDQLKAVRDRYVSVPDYEELRTFLVRRRLLVLTGQPGTGRTTTAIHLLDDVTDSKVFRLDPAVTAVCLQDDDVEPKHGYLGIVADNDPRTSAVAADRFADVLRRRSAFCVLVVGDHGNTHVSLAAYVSACRPPDPLTLVGRHIDADRYVHGRIGLAERLRALAGSHGMQAALGPAPRTHEAAGLARLLLSHGRGDIGIDEVETELAGFLDDQISQWLAPLDGPVHGERGERARRLVALRIALAVFDGLPAHLARSAADSLALWMAAPAVPQALGTGGRAVAPVAPRAPALTGEDDRNLVGSTRLVQERTRVTFRGAEVPAEVLRFADRRAPSALLRHVWTRRPALRPPVIAWLDHLSRDPAYAVRVRAAQAAGLLCAVDFGHVFTALIEPAARARERRRSTGAADVSEQNETGDVKDDVWRRRREFAALALDHAARDPEVRAAVTRTLKRWRRSKSEPALRWTAAAAWGYDIGQNDVDTALEELRVLGTPWETNDFSAMRDGHLVRDWNRLLYTSGQSIAFLFGTGAHDAVLQRLHEWITDRTSLRKLAVQAVVLMIGLPVSGLGRPENEHGGDLLLEMTAGRGQWPALLALQGRYNAVVGPAADLVRTALRSSWRDVVADTLERWFDLCASDEAALDAVETFLPLLVVEESDRARLRGLVRRKQRVWADPLPVEVAMRLDAALASVQVVPGPRRVVYT